MEWRGILWPAGDVMAVVTKSAPGPEGAPLERKWWVHLAVRGQSSDDRVTELEAILEQLPKATDGKREELQKRLVTWAIVACGSIDALVETYDEHQAWGATEALARALRVPSIDVSGDRPIVRAPADLDRPLAQALVEAGEGVEDPGPAPRGLRVRDEPGRLQLAWTTGYAWVLRPTVGVAMILIASGAVGVFWDWMAGVMIVPYAIVLTVVIVLDPRWGKMELELGDGRLRWTRRRPWRARMLPLELEAVEKICFRAKPRPVVSLVTDGRVLPVYVDDGRGAWLQAKLEHWLHTHEMQKRRRCDGRGTGH